MNKLYIRPYQLKFNTPVLTSRGSMFVKNGYFLFLNDGKNTGAGECSFIEDLSIDNLENYHLVLHQLCENQTVDLQEYPSIKFGLECAQLDLANGGQNILFESNFTQNISRIPINGLVWMGDKDFMFNQIERKLKEGFKCIKIKVGAIDFDEETELIRYIRSKFPADVVEIRLDANGAFSHTDVFQKLEKLSAFQIHSIEQPVKQGQPELMKKVCVNSPIHIALDEELIGIDETEQFDLLNFIQPTYIILKPSLLGGFTTCEQWIKTAERLDINWWATSALESNVGLNAIAQWVYTKQNPLAQGLGTGGLYTNNISSPLYITQGNIGYNPDIPWDTNFKL